MHFNKTTDGRSPHAPNYGKINLLEIVIGTVMDRINRLDTSELNIPLGNIINGEIFSGMGPRYRKDPSRRHSETLPGLIRPGLEDD